MYSVFAGMGTQLQSRICKDGEELDYEITSFYEEPVRTSGGTVVETDSIPSIRSYEVYNVMRARLSREE